MICPKCRNQMEFTIFDTVEIERCQNCRSIWFDMADQEKVRRLNGSVDAAQTATKQAPVSSNGAPKPCPICGSRMIPVVDRKAPHIRFETCAICHGVFMDRELNRPDAAAFLGG